MGRGRRQRRTATRPVLIATLCVLGLLAAGWAVVSEIRRSPGPSTTTPTAPATSPSTPPTSLVVPAVQACTGAVKSGDVAVSRARSAIADWSAHVRAMVDQEAGRNTSAQTKQIWAR